MLLRISRAKIDRQLIAGVSHLRFAAATPVFWPNSVVDEAAIGRRGPAGFSSRGVGGGVFRIVVADGLMSPLSATTVVNCLMLSN